MPYVDKTVTVNGVTQTIKLWKSVFNGPQIDESLSRILSGAIDNAEASAAASAQAASVSAQAAASSAVQAAQSAARADQAANQAAQNVTETLADYVTQAEQAKVSAEYFKEGAEAARDSIENMTVSAGNLPPGSDATAVKTAVGGSFNIRFGIPEGKQGATGPEGKQGKQGPPGKEGPRGIDGVAVAADGVYAFNVNEDGDLILSYTGEDTPDFKINADGNLILTI